MHYEASFVTRIPLQSIERFIQASFSVARTIVLVIGVPNQCFPYLNFLGVSAQVFFVFLVIWFLPSYHGPFLFQKRPPESVKKVQIYEQRSAKTMKYRIVIFMLGLMDRKTERCLKMWWW